MNIPLPIVLWDTAVVLGIIIGSVIGMAVLALVFVGLAALCGFPLIPDGRE
jgi:hypothetical protein